MKLSTAQKAALLIGATAGPYYLNDIVHKAIRRAEKHPPSGTLPEHRDHNAKIERKRQDKLAKKKINDKHLRQGARA